jgi:riboflavin biosynthesis pyrimidine reductase
MSARTDPPRPIELNRVFPGGPASFTAEQVVEGLRLWDAPPAGAQEGRVRVLLNMASTADGRATVGGRSSQIGNRADRELFHALRAAVDAVLVGAGTVRAERYQRLVRDESRRRLRRERGLSEEPLACIVSASLDLPADIPLLRDPAAKVAILTPSPDRTLPGSTADPGTYEDAAPASHKAPRSATPADRKLPGSAAPVEYVRTATAGQLDLSAALAELNARFGVRTLLCEGGPHLNSQLLAAGLVDELFLTFAPKLAGGGAPGAPATEHLRILSGPELEPPSELELLHVLESEGYLLLRYRLGGAGAGGTR